MEVCDVSPQQLISSTLKHLLLESRSELSAPETELEKDISWCEGRRRRSGWEEDSSVTKAATVHHFTSPLLQVLCLFSDPWKVGAGCGLVIEERLAAMLGARC
ncbi:unnamed protein product [Pleuronectes platessa]|uniref:Uncharacterized protein n=1 Tax=Pleuronectes platessa TaxID=8262 RepID=A0A9N7U223_PLEPL|nr:unnamed protein product [Pleuronectes platessa]